MTGFRWTIKRKLLTLGAGTLLPLLLLIVFWVWWEGRKHEEDVEAGLTLASRQAAGQVEGLLEHLVADLNVLGRNPAVQRRQVGRMEESFRDLMTEHPEIENVFVLTAGGRIVATAVPPPPGPPPTLESRPWFQQVMARGQIVVGGFEIGRIVGQPVAVMAVPIPEAEGSPAGIAVAAMSLSRLHVLFEALPLGGGKTVTVVDGEGVVLSHAPGDGGHVGRRLPSSAALASKSGVARNLAWFEGGERIAAAAPVAGTDWRVLATIPRASLTARVWELGVTTVALPLVGLLAISGLIGLLIAMRVWRPLQALTEAVARFPEGGRISVDVRSTDEVGELARAFSDMAAQVAESRASLERRIEEVTALSEAARAIAGEPDLDRLLQRIVETARELLGAGYGALLVLEGGGRAGRFFTAGMTPEERERIGPPPEGRGLLGHVLKDGETLRLDDLTTHPAAAGFPSGHPPMRTLLAIPLRVRGEILGALYLTEKPGGFTAGDEALLTTLSVDAAASVENARLVADLRRALDDLTAAQDRLVQTEALRAVGEVAAGTAHHLNNILAVIGGRVEILLRNVEEPSIRRSLEIVQRAVGRGAEVVRRVREFGLARPGSQAVPVDLNYLVREALELTQPRWKEQAQTQGIHIEVRMEPGPIPAVAGDPVSLGEVLVNLLLNAVDALPEGGQITVKTWVSDQRVHCAVTDTGVGMSEEVRRRASEPFFTTKGPRSTGLGLSVSHGVLQRHGGELAIESAPGRGTTVTISLPLALVGAAEPTAATPSLPASSRRILVIDDEAEVRETLAEILARQGHLVSQAASGLDGVTMFRAERHDLVFTNLAMPGMSGLELAEAIKALSPDTSIVLVTGWADQPAFAEADVRHVDQLLQKPFDPDAVAEIMARIHG